MIKSFLTIRVSGKVGWLAAAYEIVRFQGGNIFIALKSLVSFELSHKSSFSPQPFIVLDNYILLCKPLLFDMKTNIQRFSSIIYSDYLSERMEHPSSTIIRGTIAGFNNCLLAYTKADRSHAYYAIGLYSKIAA